MNVGVSIVIPTYNRAESLRRTLESLAQVERPPRFACELIVVDNNCSDDTAEVVDMFARAAPWPVRRVVESRQGLNHSRNRGLKEARFDYVAFFDDDVEVGAGWLSGAGEAIERYRPAAIVGPVTPVFEPQPPPGLAPRVLEKWLGSCYSRKGDRTRVLEGTAAHEITGCNFAVRKEAALGVGGFDVELDRCGDRVLGGGDFEMGERLVRAGHTVVYEPRCAVCHRILPSKTTRTYLRRLSFGVGLSRALMERRRNRQVPVSRRLRYAVGLLGGAARVLGLYASGRRSDAFERELEWREGFGYLAGHARKRARL